MENRHNVLSLNDINEVTSAVEDFNQSPWNDFDQMVLADALASALEIGVGAVLESIRRADIRGFHAEEAINGDI
jgi:hypothetical protein